LVVDHGDEEEVMYGPYIDTMKNMAGPKVCHFFLYRCIREKEKLTK